MTDLINFEPIDTSNGKKLGIIELNSPKTLNSLTLEMVKAIESHLAEWESNEDLVAIVLKGAGGKAFCAGGDVQELYRSASGQPGGPCKYAEEFFLEEYVLDYHIHQYTKPIICLGSGIVMGGGMGLMAGASHRIVTENSRLAMPEVTIGLYPDVGATWFLKHVPHHFGFFFALTGATINGNDAVRTKLADACLPKDNIESFETELLELPWSESSSENHKLIDHLVERLKLDRDELDATVPSHIAAHLNQLEQICSKHSFAELVHALDEYHTEDDWLIKAKETLHQGSPFSTVMIFEQLMRQQALDLRSAFISEYQLSTNMVRYPEFAEGVRALLIDKDKTPKWQFKHYSEIPNSLIAKMFTAPWDENPLELRI